MSIDIKIPEDSPVRLVNRIVDELDLTDIDFGYKGAGNSSYHLRMMQKSCLTPIKIMYIPIVR